MLDVEQHSGVSVVRLRRGKVNALDLELLQAITAAMNEAGDDAAVVLTGSGRPSRPELTCAGSWRAGGRTRRSSCPR